MKKTVTISVTLDTSSTANPNVGLTDENGNSGRSVSAASGDTIKWMRSGSSDTFDVSSLEPTGENESFSATTPGGNGQWLSTTYQPTDTSPTAEFPYTLTVTLDGVPYTTTIRNTTEEEASDKQARSLSDGKPVIRN